MQENSEEKYHYEKYHYDVKFDQWYEFKSMYDKHQWLETVMGETIRPMTQQEIDFYLKCDLLKLQYNGVIAWNQPVLVHEEIMVYKPGLVSKVTKLMCNSNKSEIGETKMDLIRKAYEKEVNIVREECSKEKEEFISTTKSGLTLKKAVNEINEQQDVNVKLQDVFELYMLSDADIKILNSIDKKEEDKIQELIDKYDEARELFAMTTNYQEKLQVLHSYGIIKYSKSL